MVPQSEISIALGKLAVMATRRVGEDQIRQMAEVWQEELRDVEPIGFRRAAHAYVQEGKWPTVGEFRTRAKGMTPGFRAPEDEVPDSPACPKGHRLVWREFTNPNGRKLGLRPWCLCEDRTAALYGHEWGAEAGETGGVVRQGPAVLASGLVGRVA